MKPERNWESAVDRAIRQAMEDGRMANLPGEGKPLDLSDDPNTPDDMKLAYKILRENDLAPDWIMAGAALDDRRRQLLDRLTGALRSYQSAGAEPAAWARAEHIWRTFRQKLTAEADRLNKDILAYNLKVPAGVTHKLPLDIQREITRLQENEG